VIGYKKKNRSVNVEFTLTTLDSEINSVNNKLNEKANISHTHTKSQITDFPTSIGSADWAAGAQYANQLHVPNIVMWNGIDIWNSIQAVLPLSNYIGILNYGQIEGSIYLDVNSIKPITFLHAKWSWRQGVPDAKIIIGPSNESLCIAGTVWDADSSNGFKSWTFGWSTSNQEINFMTQHNNQNSIAAINAIVYKGPWDF
jgi:hypothetical protein